MPNPQIFLNKSVQDFDLKVNAFPTLYVLVGGSGMKTGMKLRKRVLEAYGVEQLPFQEFIWMDTDPDDQKAKLFREQDVFQRRLQFKADETVSLSVPRDKIFDILSNRHNYTWLESWSPHAVLEELGKNAGADEGARQIRPLGRLAFELNFREFRRVFEQKLQRLTRVGIGDECEQMRFEIDVTKTIEVVMICSIAGGTGSGAFLQAARAIQTLAGSRKINLTGYFYLPSIFENIPDGVTPEMFANAYASLQELNALAVDPSQEFHVGDFKSSLQLQNPFNQIYLVEKSNINGLTLQAPIDDDAYSMVGDALFYDFEQSEFGMKKRSHRNNVAPSLALIQHYQIPVDDDTLPGTDSRQPAYVFKYPLCFGAFGVARVPFDRQRLQRAGGSLLARRMLQMLLNTDDDNASIDPQLFRKHVLVQAQISADHVIDRLLFDETTGATFDQAFSQKFKNFNDDQVRQTRQRYELTGVGSKEFLSRLRSLNVFADDLNTAAETMVSQLNREILDALNAPKQKNMWGRHYRFIRERQNLVFDEYQGRFRATLNTLLADPSSRGLPYAEMLCTTLRTDLLELAVEAERIQAPAFPEFPKLELAMKHEVEEAITLLAEAEALWLPGYSQLAVSHYKRQNQRLLEVTSSQVISSVNQFLLETRNRFSQWAREHYHYIAQSNSAQLFRKLAEFVGNRVEVVGEVGSDTKEVQVTGMMSELKRYRDAIERAVGYFDGLYGAYMDVERSVRNHEPLVRNDRLIKELNRLIQGNSLLGETEQELMVQQWDTFIDQVGGRFASEGEGTIIERLVLRLIEFATQSINQANWTELNDALEAWSAEHLKEMFRGYSALDDLSAMPSNRQLSIFDKIASSSAPWVTFTHTAQPHKSVQLIGTAKEGTVPVRSWQQGKPNWVEISNKGGSITAYREDMVFPLYELQTLEQLESVYNTMTPTDRLRRHTIYDYLQLQRVRPPQDTSEATRWFKIDRDVLAAILFGLFEYQSTSNDFSYTIRGSQGEIIPKTLSIDLNGLTRGLHGEDNLVILRHLRDEVSTLERRISSDYDWAIKCLKLVIYTHNRVFPAKDVDQIQLLENELAKSLARKWAIEFGKGTAGQDYMVQYNLTSATQILAALTYEADQVGQEGQWGGEYSPSMVQAKQANVSVMQLDGRSLLNQRQRSGGGFHPQMSGGQQSAQSHSGGHPLGSNMGGVNMGGGTSSSAVKLPPTSTPTNPFFS